MTGRAPEGVARLTERVRVVAGRALLGSVRLARLLRAAVVAVDGETQESDVSLVGHVVLQVRDDSVAQLDLVLVWLT